MAPRKSRAVLPPAKAKPATKKHRKRQLDAFAIAGKVATEKAPIRSHRLGEVDHDRPSSKRRKIDTSDDDSDDLEQERPKKKRQHGPDDDVEYGSDSDGNEWTVGDVADDDDESIDSDEAFGESDEERFEGFTFRGSSSNKQGHKQQPRARVHESTDLDLNEDQASNEDEDDDFGEDGVDLATMLDDEIGSEDDQDDFGSDASTESDSADEELDDGEDNDQEQNARLRDFVEGLDGPDKVRIADAEEGAQDLTLDDLLEGADLDNSTMAALRSKKSTKGAQLVQAPLPRRQQDAIDRDVANKKAKEQLDRWKDTVIQNRRAEFLSFPLADPSRDGRMRTSTFAQPQTEKPANDLEANIQKIMEESGMVSKNKKIDDQGEHSLLQSEELATREMPVEDVLRRRAELRRQRDLMFREEIRAKRIAKIKSKAYRRVHRKERERLADKERQLMDPEGFANGELNDDEQEIADRRRAEARMSAKHKDSKWARSLRATDRAVWDDDARQGVAEAARRQEELKRRIAGVEIRDRSDASDVDTDGDDEDAVLTKLSQHDKTTQEKGVAGMKFMQQERERKRRENDEALTQLQRELRTDDQDQEEIDEEGLGRAIFGPKPASTSVVKIKRPELEEGSASEDERVDLEVKPQVGKRTEPINKDKSKSSKKLSSVPVMKHAATRATSPESGISSAWLTTPKDKNTKLDRKLARQAENDVSITTSLDETSLTQPKRITTSSNAVEAQKADTVQLRTETGAQDDDGSDAADAKPMLSKAEQNAAFHARAFAGDDVALQFANEKDALAESEDEKETSSHMPGWGSWTGSGLSKSKKKVAERARHNPLYKTKLPGIKAQDRADAKLDNVIISEKSDRKGKKYLAPMLPHQYERKEEYERSLRMPIGPEWSTKEVFQRNTRPRVVIKPGTIIEPISRPIV